MERDCGGSKGGDEIDGGYERKLEITGRGKERRSRDLCRTVLIKHALLRSDQ
jgi:hypothetical protein